MRCIYCNNEIPDGSPVCGYCNGKQNMNNMHNVQPNMNYNYTNQQNNYRNYNNNNNFNNYNNKFNNSNNFNDQYIRINNNLNNNNKKNNNGLLIAVIISILLIGGLIGFIFLLNNNSKSNNEENIVTNNEVNVNNEVEPEPDNPRKYIGTDELGYVLIPREWELDTRYDTFLYSNKNNQISLTRTTKAEADSYDVAMKYQVYFSSIRLQNIEIKKVQLKNYEAYKISAYDPSSNQTTWMWTIDTNDGFTRIITLKSSETINDYLFIPDSYTLTK